MTVWHSSLAPTRKDIGRVPPGFYPYQIPFSGKFDGTASLTRTYSVSAGWTFSVIVKRTGISALCKVLGADVQFNANDTLTAEALTTTEVFRDPSQYLHLYVSDDGLYINGKFIGVVTTGALVNLPLFDSFDGYAANAQLMSDVTVPIASLGTFKEGTWVATEYTGSYGDDGFHLDFADPLDLGKDVSGNDNHFTNSGVVQSLDTPTNNFCTLDVIDPLTTGTISNAGLTVVGGTAKVTMRPSTGKWYYEKDGVGVSYDADVNGEFDPDLVAGSYNFGASDFVGTPPAGYLPLSTANLPEPAIINGRTGFWPNVRQGTGGVVDVTGAQFDVSDESLVWIKSRTVSRSHRLTDTVRGATEEILSNATAAEAANVDALTAFLSDGFTLGDDANINTLNESYIDWVFNMVAQFGMDVVEYVGNGVAGHEIPHSLGAAPELIVIKNLEATANWVVGCEYLADTVPWNYYMNLNLTDARATSITIWNNTQPASDVFTLGTGVTVNQNTNRHIAYLFRSVPGFLKVGSYIGNGNVNGPMVNLGFRPGFILGKVTNYASNGWWMADSARSPHNLVSRQLRAESISGETTSNFELDFLSNGFKQRNSDNGSNRNGNMYMYLAIAEAPFKYANAR